MVECDGRTRNNALVCGFVWNKKKKQIPLKRYGWGVLLPTAYHLLPCA
ncbi:hypothetical protein, unlikely [Trypanosoma brucei brucei TREU927]|uniref:Uncharacterized protein n=1 Tax=Trypanosoma brucei brucei (strain 927/4 GUTat10.1) TaxID=185431 RepID=Q38F12_TRYB2|nr:hypothetical protein, unlikely [Trypanosoma brucei brucei TREU927]EAN76608.1 hypothetical protein, unlikely [Trypanosoma brucei brucei TREU927]